ncbi:MAG: hypothetical protein WCF84_18685 [Anaerolineae bacterium]
MNKLDELLKKFGYGDDGDDSGETGLLKFMALALLVFTAFKTWDWLSNALPGQWKILGLVGIVAFDGGVIIWSGAWKKARSKKQLTISEWMFVADFIGVALAFLGDSSFRSEQGAFLPAEFTNVISWGIPLVLLANVAAYYQYSKASPKFQRDLTARMDEDNQKASAGKLEQSKKKLDWVRDFAQLQMDIDARIDGLMQALAARGTIAGAAQVHAQRTLEDFQWKLQQDPTTRANQGTPPARPASIPQPAEEPLPQPNYSHDMGMCEFEDCNNWATQIVDGYYCDVHAPVMRRAQQQAEAKARSNPERFFNRPKTQAPPPPTSNREPVDDQVQQAASRPPEHKSFKLTDMLTKLGMSTQEARNALDRRGITNAADAYSMMQARGLLDGVDYTEFAWAWDELMKVTTKRVLSEEEESARRKQEAIDELKRKAQAEDEFRAQEAQILRGKNGDSPK